VNLGAEEASSVERWVRTFRLALLLDLVRVRARSARRRRVSLSWWRTDVPRSCPTTNKHDGRGPTPADSTLSPILGRVSSIEYMFILISHDKHKAGRTHDPASGKEPWHRRVARPCRDRLARRARREDETPHAQTTGPHETAVAQCQPRARRPPNTTRHDKKRRREARSELRCVERDAARFNRFE
jgi:hypothetical protein